MSMLLRKLGNIANRLDPEPEIVSDRNLRIRTQIAVGSLFRHLAIGHMAYRDGDVIVTREPSTNEDRKSLALSLKIAGLCIKSVGFLLPCSWENWQATKESLEAGEFAPWVNEHGVWGLWRADGQYIFDAQWRSVQAGKVAIESACGWLGLPLPDDAGQCLEVLGKYQPFTRLGDMDRL